MLIDDEDDLRAGLRALTAPAPPQPAERVERSVGRARAIRRRRAAVTSVALLLPALVAAGAVVTRPGPPPPDYTNVATWPDRSDPSLARWRDSALKDWLRSHDLDADERVHWLYAGRVPDAEEVVVAFATCWGDVCRRVVLTHGDAEGVLRPGKQASAWLDETRELADGVPMTPLADYLLTADEPPTGGRTVLFVLPAPDATTVTYHSPAVAGRGGGAGDLPRVGAAFTGDIGYLAAHATVSVRDDEGRVLHTATVGDDDTAGFAAQIRGIDVPAGYIGDGSTASQLVTPFGMVDQAMSRTVPHALFVRCLGAAPLRVELNGAKGTVPCDGRTHRATPLMAPVPIEDWDDDKARPSFEYSLDGDDPYTVFVATLARRV